ncbi:MAG: type II secretion system minor pseudopilin GspK [Candidatus Xenobiia bacterium LiM19]
MIIIAVLGVLIILMVMNLQLCSDSLYSAKYLSRLEHREGSYYIARSAYQSALRVLKLDAMRGDGSDSLKSLWAQDLPELDLDEGTIKVRIEDENRHFNINNILKDEKHLEQCKRLFRNQEINENFINALKDWVDEDKEATVPGGIETMKDSTLPVKNAPFDSIEELFYIDTFNDEWYNASVKMGEARPGLRDLLTVYGDEKINVNTASVEVLQSLDDSISRETAAEIISRRGEKAITAMEKLLDVPGITTDVLYRIGYLADIKSTHFRIIVNVKKGDDETILEAVVKRESGKFSPLYWKVE